MLRLLTLLFFLPLLSSSQKDSLILTIWRDQEQMKKPTFHLDEKSLRQALDKQIRQLHKRGHIAAGLDSLVRQDDTFHAFVFVGRKYLWSNLKAEGIPKDWLEESGYREKLFFNKPFSHKEIYELETSLLRKAEESGYPFAKVWLDSLGIKGEMLSAKLAMDRGKSYLFGEMLLVPQEKQGKLRIKQKYLERYLGIMKDKPYRESKVGRIDQRLRELPFLEVSKPTKIVFTGQDSVATPYLHIKNRRSSRVDGIIGLLPNNNTLTGKSELNLTGNLNLDLLNLFGGGQRLQLEWQQLRAGYQDLKLRYAHPFLLNTAFGADLAFHLYKRDTIYLDLDYSLGVQYSFSGASQIKAFWEFRQTSLLSVNRAQLSSSRQLPAILDTRFNLFGLEWQEQRYDYRFNPRKGFGLRWKAGGGFKEVTPNSAITGLTDDTGFDYGSLYDTIQAAAPQLRTDMAADVFLPVMRSATIRLGLQSGWVWTPGTLYRNELFRVGGNKLLRGFDEESIFASMYHVATLEARLIFSQNSYFYLLTEGGYIRQEALGLSADIFPFSVGLGLALETKAGIFGIGYAIGATQSQAFDFRNSKIHFGYVNLF